MFERMKNALQRSSQRHLVWLIAALLLIAVGLTVSARTWLSSKASIAESLPAPVSRPNNLPAQEKEERAVIRLLTSGFSQTEVSGTGGQYRLVATRSSREEEIVLQLKRENGELVEELTMPQEKLNWTTLIELEAGSYTLTVNNHPQWMCHITVQ